jgi:5'-3' exonuclease
LFAKQNIELYKDKGYFYIILMSIKKSEVNTKPLILVDSSFVTFYRFFATIRWFSFAYKEEYKEIMEKYKNEYDWMTNKVFIEKYEKMYMDALIKAVKKKVFNNADIIFCLDSPKETLWRSQIDCNYKGDRADLSLKHNFKPTFAYTFNTIIPNLVKDNSNMKKLRIDTIEADDIIAIICMHMKETNKDRPIYVVSGDEDFLQLGRDSIKFINFKSKQPIVLTEDEAMLALTKKLVMGDKSDCIASIFPKGSRVKKQEIIENKDKLKEYLDNNTEAKKQYDHNNKMINFENIPKKYYNMVVKALV